MGAERDDDGRPRHGADQLTFSSEWARCAPWIEAALVYAKGTHEHADVEAMIARGEAQFWPGRDAAVVTEILVYPRLKALHFWLCGGDLDELVERMRPDIEAWGRLNGCTRFTTAGRPGWRRVMERHGYAPQWNVCMKEAVDV